MRVHRRTANRHVPAEVIGWAGMLMLLAAFTLLSSGQITGDDWRFYILNGFGSGSMAYNTYVHDAKPSFILNTIFVGVSLIGLYRVLTF